MIAQHPTDSPEAIAAIAAPEPKHVWINGSITLIYTGEDLPEQPVVQLVASAWQLRKALNAAGLRSAVEAAVATADQNTRDAWEYATEYERDHPLVIAMGQAVGKTPAEVDALFALALTL